MSDERRWGDRSRDVRGERSEDDYAREFDRERRGERSWRPSDSFADYRDWRGGGGFDRPRSPGGEDRDRWSGGSGSGESRAGRWWNDDAPYSDRDWRGGEDRYNRERYSSPYGGDGLGGGPRAGDVSWRDSRNDAGGGRWEDEWRADQGGRPARGYAEGRDDRSRWGGPQARPGAERERWWYGGEDRRDGRAPDHDRGHALGERNWMEQARDEVASWFGDQDAEARRDRDRALQGEHRGRGPSGYRRPDERIREDVHDRLTDDSWLDATGIEVQVQGGEVTLSGLVHDKTDKRRAESLAERVSGVMHVQNLLRVKAPHGVMHTAGSEQSEDAAAGTAPQASAAGPSGSSVDSQRSSSFGSAATGASTAAGRKESL